MDRRKFLTTSAASVATVLVPLPAIGNAGTIYKTGLDFGAGDFTVVSMHINCRCVISPELAGRRARYELAGTLKTK